MMINFAFLFMIFGIIFWAKSKFNKFESDKNELEYKFSVLKQKVDPHNTWGFYSMGSMPPRPPLKKS